MRKKNVAYLIVKKSTAIILCVCVYIYIYKANFSFPKSLEYQITPL